MTDYAELVKSLRLCATKDEREPGGCLGCEFDDGCEGVLLEEAADAIEELQRKERFHAFLWNTIQPNEMELYLAMYRAGDGKEER